MVHMDSCLGPSMDTRHAASLGLPQRTTQVAWVRQCQAVSGIRYIQVEIVAIWSSSTVRLHSHVPLPVHISPPNQRSLVHIFVDAGCWDRRMFIFLPVVRGAQTSMRGSKPPPWGSALSSTAHAQRWLLFLRLLGDWVAGTWSTAGVGGGTVIKLKMRTRNLHVLDPKLQV